MTKWQYIRQISSYGYAAKEDTILKLLDWCKKPNTGAVTEDEAREFYERLMKREKEV